MNQSLTGGAEALEFGRPSILKRVAVASIDSVALITRRGSKQHLCRERVRALHQQRAQLLEESMHRKDSPTAERLEWRVQPQPRWRRDVVLDAGRADVIVAFVAAIGGARLRAARAFDVAGVLSALVRPQRMGVHVREQHRWILEGMGAHTGKAAPPHVSQLEQCFAVLQEQLTLPLAHLRED